VPRRDPNPGAIVAGLLFIALGVLFLLDRAGGIHLDARWVWPVLLIGLGVAGLVRTRPRRL
jgi:hypothetical protein